MFQTKQFAALFMAVTLAVAAGCSKQTIAPAGPTVVADNPDWNAFVNEYVESTFKAQPMFAVQSGRHEFDGKMPDFSAAGIAAEVRRLQDERAAALALLPTALSPDQAFERDYLLSEIDDELFWLAKAEFPFKNPAWYVNQLDPEVYLSRQYAPLEQRLPGYIGYARSIPGIAAAIKANLRTPMPKSFVEYAIKGFGGFADFYRSDVPRVFAQVKDAALQKELATVNTAAINAMRNLKDWFVAQRKTANEAYALGPELYAAMLHDTDGVDMPIAAIKAAGEADAARNTAALKEACAGFAPGKTIPECATRMRAHKPTGGSVQAAREQLDELREFVRSHDLVTIPSEVQAEVAEAPPYNRGNSAYIIVPGFYEKNVASVYSISPPDPAWTAKERLDYLEGVGKLTSTSVHEVWPGHYLQFLHSNRSKSIMGRLYVGYDFAEGWAHYCEEMMWDAGLMHDQPEFHVAQLMDALWRDARLLSSIGLHTEGMTVEQSEKLFRELSFNDPGNARQQAARGTYDPAYLNYTLGKLQIKKLRDDWIAKQMAGKPEAKARDYWKPFHDAFLSYGGPPIPLVRRAMLPGDTGLLL